MINVDKWIKNNNSDKIIEIAKIYNEKLTLPDQDALNILFSKSKQVYYIDRKYNRVALWKEKNIKEKLEKQFYYTLYRLNHGKKHGYMKKDHI